MRKLFIILFLIPLSNFADEPALQEEPPPREPARKWYLEAKPGYFYFTDSLMRQFFDNGGFTIRAETGYKIWKPVAIWLDGGYFQKKGSAVGGSEELKITLATITLGLKGIFRLHDYITFYAGVGPRLFMMLLHNDSAFVRSEDGQFGIGGGFDGGFWVFPFPKYRNVFLNFFVDYSHKKLDIDEDENSSLDFDVDASGISAGIGLGARF